MTAMATQRNDKRWRRRNPSVPPACASIVSCEGVAAIGAYCAPLLRIRCRGLLHAVHELLRGHGTAGQGLQAGEPSRGHARGVRGVEPGHEIRSTLQHDEALDHRW